MVMAKWTIFSALWFSVHILQGSFKRYMESSAWYIMYALNVPLLQILECEPIFFSAFLGSEMVEVQCQRFEVKSADGERVLFSADEEEISIGTEKLRVTGALILQV